MASGSATQDGARPLRDGLDDPAADGLEIDLGQRAVLRLQRHRDRDRFLPVRNALPS